MSKLWGRPFCTAHRHTRSTISRQLFLLMCACITKTSRAASPGLKGWSKLAFSHKAKASTIIDGLEQVRAEFDEDRFVVDEGDEDIHTAV